MKADKKKCEVCGENSVVPVMYGLPTEEAFESARRGEIALGGCIIDFDNPTIACTSCGWDNRYNFDHFIEAQSQKNGGLATALTELSAGAKTSHWIWYIFPQIGLGSSPQARRFAIGSTDEAVAYLRHRDLGTAYLECLLEVAKFISESDRPIIESLDTLFGSKIDRTKFISSITLFGEMATMFERIYEELQFEHTARIWAELQAKGLTPCSATVNFISEDPD
jgi:uncharacterized protein (DUF1810 family)